LIPIPDDGIVVLGQPMSQEWWLNSLTPLLPFPPSGPVSGRGAREGVLKSDIHAPRGPGSFCDRPCSSVREGGSKFPQPVELHAFS
jgi:hypothetical protein